MFSYLVHVVHDLTLTSAWFAHANGSACSVQTAKDETAYTQVSNQAEDSPENRTNQPSRNGSYIAMSPVEAQKCWWRGLVESHLRTSRLSSTPFFYVSFHCAILLWGPGLRTLTTVCQGSLIWLVSFLFLWAWPFKLPYLRSKPMFTQSTHFSFKQPSLGFQRLLLPSPERPETHSLAFWKRIYALHAHRVHSSCRVINPFSIRELEGFAACALKVFQISSHTTVYRSTQADLELTRLFIRQTFENEWISVYLL